MASAFRRKRRRRTTTAESLETQIGSRWLLYIGVIAIVIGVAYFEKLAIDKQWIGETARVIQGAVLGLVLTYAGLRFVRAGYDAYGQMIAGGGAAILYLSTYAAFNYYHLITQPVAFVLMVGITGMVAWLADHLESQGLALFAVGGGFGTPFLLPGTTDAQVALFGYDTILIAGTMALSHRRNWPALNIVSYVFTLMTVAFWADAFYTLGEVPAHRALHHALLRDVPLRPAADAPRPRARRRTPRPWRCGPPRSRTTWRRG